MKKRPVIFVDDDEIMLRSLERGLLDEPYNKRFAKNGEDAVEILQREEIHVIVPAIRQAINRRNLQSEHEDILAELGRCSGR